jgi:hypothetical protein
LWISLITPSAICPQSSSGRLLARVVVVTIEYQTDATAKLKGNLSVSRHLAQRRQRLIDVAGFYLPAREHQDDGF